MLWEAIKLANQSVRRNVLRSILTLLGIVIGVACVIAVVAIGNSGDRRFLPLLERLVHDDDPIVASHAQWSLKKLSPERLSS